MTRKQIEKEFNALNFTTRLSYSEGAYLTDSSRKTYISVDKKELLIFAGDNLVYSNLIKDVEEISLNSQNHLQINGEVVYDNL